MGDDGTHGGYRALLEEQYRQNPNNPMPKVPQSAYRVLIYKMPIGGAPGKGNWRQVKPLDMGNPNNVLGAPKPAVTPQSGFLKVVDFSDSAKVKSAPGLWVTRHSAARRGGRFDHRLGRMREVR